MATTEKKCIIFDWDGTLINSSPCVIQAHHNTARILDLPEHDMVKLNTMLGQPSDVVSKQLTIGTDVKAIDYQSHFRNEYQKISQHIELYDFTIPLLELLNRTKQKCAIATNKPEKIAAHEIIRTGVSRFFVQKEYACQSKAKPDPTMLEKILDTQGFIADDCIMIGDQTNDADAARRLDMDCIIVHDRDRPLWHKKYVDKTIFLERTALSDYLVQESIIQPLETVKTT